MVRNEHDGASGDPSGYRPVPDRKTQTDRALEAAPVHERATQSSKTASYFVTAG
jgi:hypothetical protein